MRARPHAIGSWTRVGGAALALVLAGHAPQAQPVKVANLHVESVPTGATVELIGGSAGITPLVVSERAIYPNTYPDARADLYGIVVLRHPGCKPLRHRVALRDMEQGLRVHLDCGAITAQSGAPEASPDVAPPAVPKPPQPQEPASQRRLRQLQVIQELLDEGLISPAEERRVRLRILQSGDAPTGGG